MSEVMSVIGVLMRPQLMVFRGIKWVWGKSRPFTVGVVLVVAAVKLRAAVKRRRKRLEWAQAGKDVVVIHCMGKGFRTPSVSPFVMKLWTYLRMAEIEHKIDFTEPFGPKGKSPWITMNGQSMGDSQLIMDFLGSHFNKDLSSHLNDEQKAVAWTFTLMMDEHLSWVLKDWRWVLDWGRGVTSGTKAPWLRKTYKRIVNRRKQIRIMKVQGIGRHTHEDITQFGMRDLRALSKFLGAKPFLMGDDPCEVDCAVFGSLVQIKYNYPGSPYQAALEKEFANLGTYVLHMKERFWPDWDNCLIKRC